MNPLKTIPDTSRAIAEQLSSLLCQLRYHEIAAGDPLGDDHYTQVISADICDKLIVLYDLLARIVRTSDDCAGAAGHCGVTILEEFRESCRQERYPEYTRVLLEDAEAELSGSFLALVDAVETLSNCMLTYVKVCPGESTADKVEEYRELIADGLSDLGEHVVGDIRPYMRVINPKLISLARQELAYYDKRRHAGVSRANAAKETSETFSAFSEALMDECISLDKETQQDDRA